jgi:hypothetical protein
MSCEKRACAEANAAHVRLRRLGTESSLDSPLEGSGFEPSVPRQRDNAFRDFPVRLEIKYSA